MAQYTLAGLGIDARDVPESGIPNFVEPTVGGVTLADVGRFSPIAGDPFMAPARETPASVRDAIGDVIQHYADSIARLVTMPGRALGTYGEPVTEEEMRDWAPGMALSIVGVGAPNAMVRSAGANGGKLGSGALLPMDEASRMARAKEMGFKTDIPLYHGTATEFPAFSPAPPARNSHGPLAQTGPWTTRDPAYASDFAALSSDLRSGSSPQVLPLLHRAEKQARIDAAGLSQRELAGAVLDAWEAGHDAVLVQNYTMGAFGKVAPTTNIVVRNPNQLRSRFAAFDPSKSHLADLLASLAIVPAAGALGEWPADGQ